MVHATELRAFEQTVQEIADLSAWLWGLTVMLNEVPEEEEVVTPAKGTKSTARLKKLAHHGSVTKLPSGDHSNRSLRRPGSGLASSRRSTTTRRRIWKNRSTSSQCS
jgi:hypothetical protein